eukprot:TRINITY_DN19673_c0_g2_i1.p1 TRINITY_DN19673_c0_g2~~TRINITY_DN19673_c0_g2_i1.p1  ORF type:complete len:623 (-),score=168.08 TRINITY_DN19673_c0_g2_i1:189-2057(-)
MSDEDDDGEQEACKSHVGDDGIASWSPAPAPVVFEQVRLLKRPSRLLAEDLGRAASTAGERPRYGVAYRSLCLVVLRGPASAVEGPSCEGTGRGSAGSESCRRLQFRLGDTHGLLAARIASGSVADSLAARAWRAPKEKDERVEVPRWLTEAALALEVGETAEFQRSPPGSGDGDTAPTDVCSVSLLAACDTQDLLGDGDIVLRHFQKGTGERPSELAKVWASWRVWFARTGESVLNPAAGDLQKNADNSFYFVVDDGSIMPALEFGIKEMSAGSHGVLRVSEERAHGSLLPEGNPRLNGAAIWIEICVHRVENELQPGDHSTVEAAIAYALEKKEQGNASLRGGSAADAGRASRRYGMGTAVLEATLPGSGKASSGSRSPAPLATAEAERKEAELKLKQWARTVELCDAVLRREGFSAKAHYRRALARVELGELRGAAEDLRRVVGESPQDVGARRELAKVEGLLREHSAAEKRSFGGLFEKARQKEEARAAVEAEREKKEAASRKQKQVEQAAAEKEMLQNCEAAKAANGARAAAEAAAEVSAETPAAAPLEEDRFADAEAQAEQRIGAEDKALMERVAAGKSTATMLPQNLNAKKVEEAPPVEYEVPSFLKKKVKKRAA